MKIEIRAVKLGVVDAQAKVFKLSPKPCDCAESEFHSYPEDGQCACGTFKHHVHCAKCGGVSQWG